MHPRFGLILAGLALSLLALAALSGTPTATQAAPGAPRPQFPTLTPTLTPPPLPGCWTLGPSIGGGRYNALNSVSASGPNDVWAVGVDNGLGPLPMVVHWNGQQWVSQGVPWGGEGVMNAVAALAANDVWAVGSGRSDHWDGSAWTAVPVPGNRSPSAVAGDAGNDVWAIAEDVVIHWTGTSWAIVPLPPVAAPALYSIAAHATNDSWIVGDNYNATLGIWQTLTEHWDGTVWTVTPSPNIGTGANHLQSVTIVAANDAWAVGSYDNHGVGQTLIEHWNGSAWSVVTSPNRSAVGSWLGAVSAGGPNDVWAAGTVAGPAVTETLIEHWDGQVWSVVPSPNNGWQDNTLHGIAVAGPGEVWAVGSYDTNHTDLYSLGLTLHYQAPCVPPPPAPCPDGFQRQTVPAADTVRAIAAVAPDDIWTVGQHLLHWNGTAWSVIPGPDMGNGGVWRGVAALTTDDVWAVGSYNDGTHIQTLIGHWNGTFWDAVPSPNPGAGNYLNGVAARAANDVWAVGYTQYDIDGPPDAPLILHWDGTQWTQVPLPTVPQPSYLNAVTTLAANDAWAVGGVGPGESGTSLTLHWAGQSWQVVPCPNTYVLSSVAGRAANDVWAASSSFYSEAQILHWNGSQWTATAVRDSIFGLAMGPGQQVWIVGRWGPGGHYATAFADYWDGRQWHDLSVQGAGVSSTQLNAVAVLGPANVWAVGMSSGQAFIEHYTGPCPTAVQPGHPPGTTGGASK